MNKSLLIILLALVFSSSLFAYPPKLTFSATVAEVNSADDPTVVGDAFTLANSSDVQNEINTYISEEELYRDQINLEISASNSEISNLTGILNTAQSNEDNKLIDYNNKNDLKNDAIVAEGIAQTNRDDKVQALADLLNATGTPPIDPNDVSTWTPAYTAAFQERVDADLALSAATATKNSANTAANDAFNAWQTAVTETATANGNLLIAQERGDALSNTDPANLGALQRSEARISDANQLLIDVQNRFNQFPEYLGEDSDIKADFADDVITSNGDVISIEDIIAEAESITADNDGIDHEYISDTLTAKDPNAPNAFTTSELNPSNDPSLSQFTDLFNNLDQHLSSKTSTYTDSEKQDLIDALDNGAWERNAIDYIANEVNTNTGAIQDILAGTATNNSGDVGIQGVISKNSAGEIHIGENSLVTVEDNGVQELYARDANDSPIDIDITEGSDLLVEGVSVMGSVGANTTAIGNNTTAIGNNTTAIGANADAIDAVELSSGLDANGGYIQNINANYIDQATSLAGADNLLDSQIKDNADAIGANADAIDAVELSSGLDANGGYIQNINANYIDQATSLAGADNLLDSQIKDNAVLIADILNSDGDQDGDGKVGIDGIAYKDILTGAVHIGENSLITIEENGVQKLYAKDALEDAIDIDITEGSDLLVEGVSVMGSVGANTTAIGNNTTAIGNNTTAIGANADAIDAVELSSGLDANGGYIQNINANYIDQATSLAGADNLLDSQIKDNADAIGANADAIDAVELSSGLDANGGYIQNINANYIDQATSLAGADNLLDSQIKVNAGAIGANSADINMNRDGIAMAAAISHSTILPGNKQALDISTAEFEGSSAISINYSRKVTQGVQINFSHASGGDSHINKLGVGIQW